MYVEVWKTQVSQVRGKRKIVIIDKKQKKAIIKTIFLGLIIWKNSVGSTVSTEKVAAFSGSCLYPML